MIKFFAAFSCLVFTLCSYEGRAADLNYKWDESTLRVDGELITGVKKYHLKYSIDNVEQPLIEIDGLLTSYVMSDVLPGMYTAQIATSEDGSMGEYSEPVSIHIGEKLAAAPAKTTITVTFSCDGCDLEVK